MLLFRATMGNKSHNPAIEIYSHGRAARKRVNHQGKGVARASVDLGEVCAGLAGDLDSTGFCLDVGFRRERGEDGYSTL